MTQILSVIVDHIQSVACFPQGTKFFLEVPDSIIFFVCVSSDACYVGETPRHQSTRMKEHLKADKKSHI